MLRLITTILLLAGTASLWGQNISLAPMAFAIHRTGGGTWQWQDKPISFAGWGVAGRATYGPWLVSGEIMLMRFFGLKELPPNRFSPEQGFPWGQHATDKPAEFDTDYTEIRIVYDAGNLEFVFGKFSRSWGPGLHSLIISDKPPSYPQFGLDWQITPQIIFSYFHGELFSGLVDTHRTNLYTGIYGTQKIYVERYITAHRLEWTPLDQITLGISESVIYGARQIETLYLIPFMPLLSAEHYTSDSDNLQMSADLAWRPGDKLKIYGVFLMDEWRPSCTFDKDINRNWFAWQAGMEGKGFIKQNDHLVVEATWTDHRIYRHRYPVNDLYSYRYPVGHWIGPHAQSLQLLYALPVWGSRLMVSYLYAKRGELTEQMIKDQYASIPYDRFLWNTETLQSFDLTIAREILPQLLPDLWVEIGANHISWDNAGFDPFQPETTGPEDIKKTSFTLAFYYNFNIPGYNISLMRPS